LDRSRPNLGALRDASSVEDASVLRPGAEPDWLRRPVAMKNRREFLLTLTAGVVALAVVITPVIAEELLGVITKVDVEGKKLTVEEKESEKEVQIKVTDDTEYVTGKGTSKIDLEKLSKNIEKAKDAGKKGVFAKITHEKNVASKISVAGKKKAANP
jgi:hypothetical protein